LSEAKEQAKRHSHHGTNFPHHSLNQSQDVYASLELAKLQLAEQQDQIEVLVGEIARLQSSQSDKLMTINNNKGEITKAHTLSSFPIQRGVNTLFLYISSTRALSRIISKDARSTPLRFSCLAYCIHYVIYTYIYIDEITKQFQSYEQALRELEVNHS
jgi:hypothetical protein